MNKHKLETKENEKIEEPKFELVEDEKVEVKVPENASLLEKLGVEEQYDHGIVKNHIRKLRKLKEEKKEQHQNLNFYLFLLAAVIFVALFNFLNEQAGY